MTMTLAPQALLNFKVWGLVSVGLLGVGVWGRGVGC